MLCRWERSLRSMFLEARREEGRPALWAGRLLALRKSRDAFIFRNVRKRCEKHEKARVIFVSRAIVGDLGGGGTHVMRCRSRMTISPRIPYNAGTEHVGFSPSGQTLLAQSAVRRSASRIKGELHPTKNCLRGRFYCVSCVWMSSSNEGVAFGGRTHLLLESYDL